MNFDEVLVYYKIRQTDKFFIMFFLSLTPLSDTTMLPVDFKVDTGADGSVISKQSLMRLGMTWIG